MPDKTFAEIKRERLAMLRLVRRQQRAFDSSLERLERRIFTLLSRKTVIDRRTALTLVPLYNDMIRGVEAFERSITNFIYVSSI